MYQPRHQYGSPRHPRILPVLTGMLTGVTLIALLSLGSLFVAPQPLVAQDHLGELIHRFYAASNAVLAGSSPAALDHILAPDLITHHAGMAPGDHAALVSHLTDLRRAAPGAHLRVSTVLAEGEWAAARVSLLGLDPIVDGVPLAPAPAPPAQTEFFRVVDGKIAEYWPGGSAINVPRALPPIAVAPWMTDTAVALARFTFPTGAALRDLESPAEHLILLESGELDIRLSGSASWFEAGRAQAGWQAIPASGQELILRAGDAVLIPPGIHHTISNAHPGAATMLGIAMYAIAALGALEPENDVGDSRLIAIYDPARVGTETTWDRHVSADVLAADVGQAREGPCAAVAQTQVRVTRFALGPGESLPVHPVDGIELLAVDTRQYPFSFTAVALQPTGGTSCAIAPHDT
jgi:predicted SnoaL-like aldol condensation-catalyzing enzyme